MQRWNRADETLEFGITPKIKAAIPALAHPHELLDVLSARDPEQGELSRILRNGLRLEDRQDGNAHPGKLDRGRRLVPSRQ